MRTDFNAETAETGEEDRGLDHLLHGFIAQHVALAAVQVVVDFYRGFGHGDVRVRLLVGSGPLECL